MLQFIVSGVCGNNNTRQNFNQINFLSRKFIWKYCLHNGIILFRFQCAKFIKMEISMWKYFNNSTKFESNKFSFKKIHLKILFAQWHQFCWGFNVLNSLKWKYQCEKNSIIWSSPAPSSTFYTLLTSLLTQNGPRAISQPSSCHSRGVHCQLQYILVTSRGRFKTIKSS